MPCALASVGLALLAGAPASGAAQGPVQAPHVSSKAHVVTTLGSGWEQVAGASAGTPLLGVYRRTPRPGCELNVGIQASLTMRPLRVRGHRVSPNPASRVASSFTSTARGHHGAISWWTSGARDRKGALGAAEQRAPGYLATSARPWIVYRISVTPTIFTTDNGHGGYTPTTSCTRGDVAGTAGTARRIARGLRLSPGPPHPDGPYATA